MSDWKLVLTGNGALLHILDPASPVGAWLTLCGRPNVCSAAGYGTVEEPKHGVMCQRCKAEMAARDAA